MRVVDAEMSRFGSIRQGLVSDVRADDSVHVQSLQVSYFSAEALLLDTFHCHSRQQVTDTVKWRVCCELFCWLVGCHSMS